MRFRRFRARIERMTAKPASKVVALLLLGTILFFAAPMAIALTWLSVALVAHFIHVWTSRGTAGSEDIVFWLLFFVVFPTVAASAVASAAISGLSGALAWQVVRSWFGRNGGILAESA